MRAVDDPMPAYLAVLRLLRKWGALPESDVAHLVKQWMLVTNDFREMEELGYINMRFIGDEYVVDVALLGQLLLEQSDAS